MVWRGGRRVVFNRWYNGVTLVFWLLPSNDYNLKQYTMKHNNRTNYDAPEALIVKLEPGQVLAASQDGLSSDGLSNMTENVFDWD